MPLQPILVFCFFLNGVDTFHPAHAARRAKAEFGFHMVVPVPEKKERQSRWIMQVVAKVWRRPQFQLPPPLFRPQLEVIPTFECLIHPLKVIHLEVETGVDEI